MFVAHEQKKPILENQKVTKANIDVSRGKRNFVYIKDNHRCVCCLSLKNLTIDHIKPISKGGRANIENLQTLCKRCNERKGNRIVSIADLYREIFKI